MSLHFNVSLLAPVIEPASAKARVKRDIERSKPAVKKPDRFPSLQRPSRVKQAPEPGSQKITEKPKNHDMKSPNVVLHIVKKAHAPKPPVGASKEPLSILPSTLKPKTEKTNLKLTKNINNNDVWTTTEVKAPRRKVSTLPIR